MESVVEMFCHVDVVRQIYTPQQEKKLLSIRNKRVKFGNLFWESTRKFDIDTYNLYNIREKSVKKDDLL